MIFNVFNLRPVRSKISTSISGHLDEIISKLIKMRFIYSAEYARRKTRRKTVRDGVYRDVVSHVNIRKHSWPSSNGSFSNGYSFFPDNANDSGQ